MVGTHGRRVIPKLTPEETQRKKAEIRERLNEIVKEKRRTSLKDGKKGFLNAERKKKLAQLLLKHAAGLVKQEQENYAHKRREDLEKLFGKEQHSRVADEKALREICKQYHDKIRELTEAVYDLEVSVRTHDYMINELTIEVNDLHGKFIKPSLKKVGSIRVKEKIDKSDGHADYRHILRPTKITEESLANERQTKCP